VVSRIYREILLVFNSTAFCFPLKCTVNFNKTIIFFLLIFYNIILVLIFCSQQPVIDLQLPVQEFVAIKVPSVKEKEHTFKEKIVGSVSALTKRESTESISFKKSKFKKSNCRKRLDDD